MATISPGAQTAPLTFTAAAKPPTGTHMPADCIPIADMSEAVQLAAMQAQTHVSPNDRLDGITADHERFGIGHCSWQALVAATHLKAAGIKAIIVAGGFFCRFDRDPRQYFEFSPPEWMDDEQAAADALQTQGDQYGHTWVYLPAEKVVLDPSAFWWRRSAELQGLPVDGWPWPDVVVVPDREVSVRGFMSAAITTHQPTLAYRRHEGITSDVRRWVRTKSLKP